MEKSPDGPSVEKCLGSCDGRMITQIVPALHYDPAKVRCSDYPERLSRCSCERLFTEYMLPAANRSNANHCVHVIWCAYDDRVNVRILHGFSPIFRRFAVHSFGQLPGGFQVTIYHAGDFVPIFMDRECTARALTSSTDDRDSHGNRSERDDLSLFSFLESTLRIVYMSDSVTLLMLPPRLFQSSWTALIILPVSPSESSEARKSASSAGTSKGTPPVSIIVLARPTSFSPESSPA